MKGVLALIVLLAGCGSIIAPTPGGNGDSPGIYTITNLYDGSQASKESRPRFLSCSDGNAIRPRTGRAVVPDLNIIDTGPQVLHDARIGSRTAVVILGNDSGLTVGAE